MWSLHNSFKLVCGVDKQGMEFSHKCPTKESLEREWEGEKRERGKRERGREGVRKERERGELGAG